MNCKNCGHLLKDNDVFCIACGARVESGEIAEVNGETRDEFNFKKAKGFSYGRNFKTITTRVTCIDDNIEINTAIKVFRTRFKNTFLKHSDIQSVSHKVHFDLWDTLFACMFVVGTCLGASPIYLFLAVLFLWCAYGKVIRLELKNGIYVDIPHDSADEVHRFFEYINAKKTISKAGA